VHEGGGRVHRRLGLARASVIEWLGAGSGLKQRVM
jgi:hypothetical protein